MKPKSIVKYIRMGQFEFMSEFQKLRRIKSEFSTNI